MSDGGGGGGLQTPAAAKPMASRNARLLPLRARARYRVRLDSTLGPGKQPGSGTLAAAPWRPMSASSVRERSDHCILASQARASGQREFSGPSAISCFRRLHHPINRLEPTHCYYVKVAIQGSNAKLATPAWPDRWIIRGRRQRRQIQRSTPRSRSVAKNRLTQYFT
jgi:hypothetical protein